MYCLFSKYFIEYTVTKKSKRIILFFATILSMMVVLANYKCLSNFTGEHFVIIKMVVEWSILLLGGGILFNEILATVSYRSFYMKKTRINRKIFLLAYGLIVTTNVIILLGTLYPGILSSDSISQIKQILTHSYSNHHPYYYTQIIHICIKLGEYILGNINKAVALYSIFSIMTMAFCFIYVVKIVYIITENNIVTLITFFCI